jgi:chromosomal replication initiation ATPase DnaA
MTQLAFEFPHRPAFGAEDFLVAPSNEEAIAWLDRWPDWPLPALILYGPPGCGKTHLVHVWQARSGAAINRPEALTVAAVPTVAAAASALAVDGADQATERALLHLVNLAAERRLQLLLTASDAPQVWAKLPDLRSRLLAMPAVAVRPPDDALIAAVLLKLFADRQLAVGEEVVAYLLLRMERSFAAARRTVAALDQAALAAQRRVTVALARQVLDGSEGGGG